MEFVFFCYMIFSFLLVKIIKLNQLNKIIVRLHIKWHFGSKLNFDDMLVNQSFTQSKLFCIFNERYKKDHIIKKNVNFVYFL